MEVTEGPLDPRPVMRALKAHQIKEPLKDSHPEYLPHPLEPRWTLNVRPITYVEQYQRRFSASFRSHWNWTEKLKDRAYFVGSLRDAQKRDRYLCKEKVLTWRKEDVIMVYDELVNCYEPYVKALREQESFIEPDIDSVWREDDFLDDDGLRPKLIAAVDTIALKRNRHSDSQEQVVSLVDPYRWPIVYGRTVSNDGTMIKRPRRPYRYDPTRYSRNFCWLPSEFEVSADGESTKIASYINNLALLHEEQLFYPILEKIFTYFVPLFDRTLTNLQREQYKGRRVRPPPLDPEIWDLSATKHRKLWERLLEQFEKSQPLEGDFDSDTSDGAESEGLDEDPAQENHRSKPPKRQRMIKVRELASYRRRKRGRRWVPPALGKSTSLKGQTTKVVVRMTSVILSPQNPKLKAAGNWKTEGSLNERIVATGVYCYSQKNVENSKIIFGLRTRPLNTQREDWERIYNMSKEIEIQEIGSTPLKVPTTREITPQQPDVRREIDDVLSRLFPRELTAMILRYLPPTIPNSDASTFKREFLDERLSIVRPEYDYDEYESSDHTSSSDSSDPGNELNELSDDGLNNNDDDDDDDLQSHWNQPEESEEDISPIWPSDSDLEDSD
ncbi:hypothetical protein TWF281_009482 [Arthrobotrys megalospora]